MNILRMPSFGADMESGLLSEWWVRPGERVEKGDVVALIETQKGAIEMEVFQPGVIRRLLVAAGDRVPVGQPIAEIAEIDEGAAARIKASPLARRRAEHAGIDLAGLSGSGPDGAIVAADIAVVPGAREAPAAEAATTAAAAEPGAIRQAIAGAMARSKREIPHYYLASTVDLQAASDWLHDYNRDRVPEQQLLLTALLHKAVALALRDSPALNGFFEAGEFRPAPEIHLGTAIALRSGGLITPALLHADRLSLAALMAALRDLTLRVRRGGLRSAEMTAATATLTGLGERGVETVYGVIYPPQVAIIGLGTPQLRPWVVAGRVLPRLLLNVTLAADHRVSDGRQGAKFLRTLDQLLQQPEAL